MESNGNNLTPLAAAAVGIADAVKKGPKPTRPLSAYNLFFRVERTRILNGCDDTILSPHDVVTLIESSSDNKEKRKHKKTHGKISFIDLARVIADRWNKLEDELKCIFQCIAEQKKSFYKKQLKAWKAGKEIPQPPTPPSRSNGNNAEYRKNHATITPQTSSVCFQSQLKQDHSVGKQLRDEENSSPMDLFSSASIGLEFEHNSAPCCDDAKTSGLPYDSNYFFNEQPAYVVHRQMIENQRVVAQIKAQQRRVTNMIALAKERNAALMNNHSQSHAFKRRRVSGSGAFTFDDSHSNYGMDHYMYTGSSQGPLFHDGNYSYRQGSNPSMSSRSQPSSRRSETNHLNLDVIPSSVQLGSYMPTADHADTEDDNSDVFLQWPSNRRPSMSSLPQPQYVASSVDDGRRQTISKFDFGMENFGLVELAGVSDLQPLSYPSEDQK